MKVKAKQIKTKMTPRELEKYMMEVKKSSHVFKSKKDYSRQNTKKGVIFLTDFKNNVIINI